MKQDRPKASAEIKNSKDDSLSKDNSSSLKEDNPSFIPRGEESNIPKKFLPKKTKGIKKP
jgi:hypothetical protein